MLTIAAIAIKQISFKFDVPIFGPIFVLAVIFSVFGFNENHGVRKLPQTARSQAEWGSLKAEFQKWLRARSNASEFKRQGKPYPVFVVAAEGGGIYAAVHSALALTRLHDLCPKAAEHIFAISAVSGGSLGAAVYSALMRSRYASDDQRKKVPILCDVRALSDPKTMRASTMFPDGLERRARALLSNDFLSPLARATLFADFFQNFLPFPVGYLDRARALEDSFATAWSNGGSDPDAFREDFRKMWDPAKLAPALVLNATIVSTGERIVISPFQIDAPYKLSHFPVGGAPEAGQSTGGISLSTAIALSARFPWVTPAGTIEGDPIIFGGKREPQADDRNSDTVVPASAKRPRLQLVDGGYADNSGVHTALDIIDGLKAVQADPSFPEKFEVHLLVLRVEDVKKDPVLVSDYLAPIATLLSIREAQSRDAIGRAQRLFGDKASKIASSAKLFEFIHANTAYTLPLGWQISDLTNSIIASSLGHPKQCSSDPSLNQSGPGCMLTKIMAALALQEVKTALAPSVVAKPPVSAGNPLSKERLISCLASSTELFRGSVTAQQADGIAEIVKAWTDQNRTKDSRQLAYVLATAYFETARTMVPIREYGAYRSTIYLNKANEKNYYGRGYIQLVWASNYKKVGDAIKVDLYNNPDLMLEKTISAQALVASMAEGLLTGRKLSDFFAEDADWIGARKIVNGLNRADLIGSFAQQFNACLSGAGATLAYDN